MSGRLLVLARDGSSPVWPFLIDRTRSAQQAAAGLVREIDVRLSHLHPDSAAPALT